MGTVPRPKRRILRRKPPSKGSGTRPIEPMTALDRRRERVRLALWALGIAAILTFAVSYFRPGGGHASPPREVEQIAAGLRAAGHSVDRVARNANGGWSVLFGDGEVQWFRSQNRAEARLHPIRVLTERRPDPNVAVFELHPTVFVIALSGRRHGDTLQLGAASTDVEQITATVRTAVAPRTKR